MMTAKPWMFNAFFVPLSRSQLLLVEVLCLLAEAAELFLMTAKALMFNAVLAVRTKANNKTAGSTNNKKPRINAKANNKTAGATQQLARLIHRSVNA